MLSSSPSSPGCRDYPAEALDKASDALERDSYHNKGPPIRVIVLKDEASYSCLGGNEQDSPDRAVLQRYSGVARLHSPAVSASTAFSNFRLQPRSLKCILSTPKGENVSRGKKRRAHSLNEESPLSSTFQSNASDTVTFMTQTTITKGSTRGSPIPTADEALVNLQGLSIRSPGAGACQRRAYTSTESPVSLVGSQSNRSSFSKYNATSPTVCTGGASPGSGSFMSKSSSPKRAPCTVIFGQSISTSGEPTRSPGAFSKRPPLHSGMAHLMHSQDETAGRASLKEHTPVLADPPLNSIHWSTASHMASPCSHDSRLTECTAYFTSSNLQSTPFSKQSRNHEFESPSRRSSGDFSPHRTPLPKLTLTPRSADSKRTRGSELPIFPMDLDTDVRASAPSSSPSSSRCLETPPSLVNHSERRGSFFPLLDWQDDREMADGFGNSASLMSPQANRSPSGPLDSTGAIYPPRNSAFDTDSLSPSDDGDDFFLAAPSVIKEEKYSFAQISKHRKLDFQATEVPPRCIQPIHRVQSGLASNTSLLGMDFILSSSNLQNMDRLGSKVFSQTSFEELSHLHARGAIEAPLEDREESPTSIGLVLDSCHPTGPSLNHHEHRALTTPPTVPTETLSTPPLMKGSNHETVFDDDYHVPTT